MRISSATSTQRAPLRSVTLQKRPLKRSNGDDVPLSSASPTLLEGNEALGNVLWRPISVFKKKETASARDWLATHSSAKQQLLTVDTSYFDSSDGDASTSDYASLTPTVVSGGNSERASHDAPSSTPSDWQCCVWDWRSTHIGAFKKKQRLNVLKRRLDQLECPKSLPIDDTDFGRASAQKLMRRASRNDPHQECFVTDVSHRSRRCAIFRRRRHVRVHGQFNEAQLQKVQVPVEALFSEPKVDYTTDLPRYLLADAARRGFTKREMSLLTGVAEPSATEPVDSESEALAVRRLSSRRVADYALSVEDGRFWRQLNLALWQKRGGVRRDENNHKPALHSTIVLKRADLAYIIALLEATCFTAMHDMLLDVLNVPNQADDDNAICEICQSDHSDANDLIVFCEGCELAVHQHCFGIETLPKRGWYCKACASAQADLPCRFCPLTGGTMKPTVEGAWAHFACAVWQQSIRFEDLTTFEPITNEWNLPCESLLKICSVCDLCYGSCIQCSVSSCKIPFHPTCGLRGNLYMFIEDSSKSKIGVRLFAFCAYHSDKARAVRTSSNNQMEFILEQLSMNSVNTPLECYKRSQIGKLEAAFEQFVNWRRLADELAISHDLMESVFSHWSKQRKARRNRPLVDLYEANEVYVSEKFRDALKATYAKRATTAAGGNAALDEQMNELIKEYAKAHCILDKGRNLATLTLRREKMKLQIVMLLRRAFEESTAHLDGDSHLSARLMERIAAALHEHIHGPNSGELRTSTAAAIVDEEAPPPSKRARTSAVATNARSTMNLALSPSSRRTAKFTRPFSRAQHLFVDLFDADVDLARELFDCIPSDCA